LNHFLTNKMTNFGALGVMRAMRDAHQVEVDKIAERNDADARKKAEEAKRERLREVQRQREREDCRRREQLRENQRRASQHQRAADMFARHADDSGLLGRDALCALLAEALPPLHLEAPTAETVDLLLRRAALDGLTREGPSGNSVDFPGVAAIMRKYADLVREQTVLDEAFVRLGGLDVLDGAALLALLAQLAPEQSPTEEDVCALLRAAGFQSDDATFEGCAIAQHQMRLLLPALARWVRPTPKGAHEAPLLQGEPFALAARPAGPRAPSAPARVPQRATASSSGMCTLQ